MPNILKKCVKEHCVKSIRIRSYSGPYFPAFRLNLERYFVSLRIHSECWKILTRITPNTETFYAVEFIILFYLYLNCSANMLVFVNELEH